MTNNTDRAIKTLATRIGKLLAQLEAGDWDSMSDCTDLLVRVNAATLKLDRMGAPELADQLNARKSAAVAAGEQARRKRVDAQLEQARADHRDAMRNDPAAWMRK